MTKFSSRVLAATAGLCLIAGAAKAADVRISYRGLDLSQPEQAMAFKARVEAATRRFCDSSLPGVVSGEAQRACRAAIWDEVTDQLPPAPRQALIRALQPQPRIVSAAR